MKLHLIVFIKCYILLKFCQVTAVYYSFSFERTQFLTFAFCTINNKILCRNVIDGVLVDSVTAAMLHPYNSGKFS